jgi:CheY-like chemotaxis protein
MPHTLLLADDSVTIQRVIELTFSGQDVDVLAVGDGEQAIARIQSDRPDIVLADIGMPKRSGYDVAAFVKGDPELRHIPVLLLAGAFEPVDDVRAAQVGCDGVLVKPFEPQQVIARVKELLAGATGTPTQATADVPRAVDRLAPRTLEFPSREERPPVDRPAHEEPPAFPPLEQFEMPELPAPYEEPAAPAEPAASFVPPSERGADESLEDYFSRLDAAFSSLSAPSPSSAVETPHEEPTFDDPLDLPTLDDLLGDFSVTSPGPPIDLPLNAPPVAPATPMPLVSPPPIEPPETPPTLAPAPANLASEPLPDWTRSSEWTDQREQPSEPASHWALPAHEPMSQEPSVVADAFKALLAVEQGEPGAVPVRLTTAAPEPVITEAFLDEVVRRVLERLGPDVARALVAEIVSDVSERLVKEEIERIRKKM